MNAGKQANTSEAEEALSNPGRDPRKVIDLIYYHHPLPLINGRDQPYRLLVTYIHAMQPGLMPSPSEAMIP